MTQDQITLEADRVTGRGRTLNPFAVVKDAVGFIAFAEDGLRRM